MDDFRRIINLLEEQEREKLELAKLPYKKDALAPVMSEQTINIHYNKLTKGYFENIDKGPYFEAGAFLHNLWWENLQPHTPNNNPKDNIAKLIDDNFGDFSKFKDEFTEAAITIQGNGWCALTKTGKIVTIPNHKKRNDIALLLDMWEHSFFLDYHENKKEYVKNWWKLVNWGIVNSRL